MKLDLPALELALASPAFYIGALGSKRTHAKRVKALEEKGYSADVIDRDSRPDRPRPRRPGAAEMRSP